MATASPCARAREGARTGNWPVTTARDLPGGHPRNDPLRGHSYAFVDLQGADGAWRVPADAPAGVQRLCHWGVAVPGGAVA